MPPGYNKNGRNRGGEWQKGVPKTQLRKYTPSTLAKICLIVRNGNSRSDAFRRVGIHVDTGFFWLAQGRKGEGDPIFVRFLRVLEKAEANFNQQMVRQVTTAANSGAPNTWQAAMTMLERRDPENWARREKTTIETGGGPLVQLNQVVLVDEDARDASRALLRRVAGLGSREPLGIGMGDEPEEARPE